MSNPTTSDITLGCTITGCGCLALFILLALAVGATVASVQGAITAWEWLVR